MFNFTKEIAGTVFEFKTMHTKKLQAFQVYVLDGGIRKRFHLQIDPNNEFRITDPQSAPDGILPLEKDLSYAIFEQARTLGVG
jgi:hypothetical protein